MSRGKPPAPKIEMTSRQYELLSQEYRRSHIASNIKVRIGILLKASKGESINSIHRSLSTSVMTVKHWRRRWAASYEWLLSYEVGQSGAGVSDRALLGEMLLVLQDEPRSGAPKRITLAQEQQIIALSCKAPEDYGIEMTHWTHEYLAAVAKSEGIVSTISPRHVGNILKKK